MATVGVGFAGQTIEDGAVTARLARIECPAFQRRFQLFHELRKGGVQCLQLFRSEITEKAGAVGQKMQVTPSCTNRAPNEGVISPRRPQTGAEGWFWDIVVFLQNGISAK
ncbi:hypothetical protein IN67_03190 [Salmonella enterica]|nr:hypothetical protein IN67_03190 [Salmonella enterica]